MGSWWWAITSLHLLAPNLPPVLAIPMARPSVRKEAVGREEALGWLLGGAAPLPPTPYPTC